MSRRSPSQRATCFERPPSLRGRHRLLQRKGPGLLREVVWGQPLQRLCSRNFSEKRLVLGSIAEGSADGMADCFPEGWGQGQYQGMGNQLLQLMTAKQKTQSPSLLSYCKPNLSGGERASAMARALKGRARATQHAQGREKNPNLQPFSERATATTEKIKCLSCPAYSWTTRSVCRSRGHTFSQGKSHKTPPSQKSLGQASAKQGGGGPSSSAVSSVFFLGLLWYKRRNWPG